LDSPARTTPSPLRLPQLDKWAQCGGKSGGFGADAADAGACCPVNYRCIRGSEHYWQCQPYQDPVVYYTECPGKTEVRGNGMPARKTGRQTLPTAKPDAARH
jgi:hypothetical protein